jgi:catechol 2,3-dioxygenase-like lactoylglutathione lyase family enzyme
MTYISGLHHVQLAAPAGSEPRMREFFGTVLGLTEVAKPADLAARGGAWFRGPGFELHVGIDKDFVPARKAHPGLLVSDLSGLQARLAAAGHEVQLDDDLATPDGKRFTRFFVTDPVGNRLEFLQPVMPNSSRSTSLPPEDLGIIGGSVGAIRRLVYSLPLESIHIQRGKSCRLHSWRPLQRAGNGNSGSRPKVSRMAPGQHF